MPKPRPAASRSRKLVLVHGRDQQGLDETKLKNDWIKALKRGLAAAEETLPDDVEIVFPYYGDQLLAAVDEIDNGPQLARRMGAGAPPPDAALESEMLEEFRAKLGISQAEVKAELPRDAVAMSPLGWRWSRAILRAIDTRYNKLSEKTVAAFTRDVHVYLSYPVVRRAINATVAAAIGDGATVVVGHSLGSIVAYDCLRQSGQTSLYVTVGSPLGLNSIKKRLLPIERPAAIENWYNAMDGEDIVALYSLTAKNFPAQPIKNKTDVKNHTGNHHGIVGYLDDPAVATSIVRALRAQ